MQNNQSFQFIKFTTVIKNNNYHIFEDVIGKILKEYDVYHPDIFKDQLINGDGEILNVLAKEIAETNYLNKIVSWDELIANEYLNIKCNNIAYVFFVYYGIINNYINHSFIYSEIINVNGCTNKAHDLLFHKK